MEANTFPNKTKDWGKLLLTKNHGQNHESRELHIRACGGKEPFNSANAAAELPTNSERKATPPDNTAMDCFEDYLDSIANAATNEKAFLELLVATNDKQEATIDTQATTIKSLTVQVRTLNEQVLSLKNKGIKAGGRGGHTDSY